MEVRVSAAGGLAGNWLPSSGWEVTGLWIGVEVVEMVTNSQIWGNCGRWSL